MVTKSQLIKDHCAANGIPCCDLSFWKWDIGDQITIPRDSGGYTRGMVMGHVFDQGGDPYGDRYIVKDDDSPNAVYYQKKFLEREAFVSQLSFKEQAMDELGG